MWNIEKDGTINDRFPGDFDKSLDKKNWLCSKCGKSFPSKSHDIFYIRKLDFVYHRDSDGHLYPCMEEGGPRFVGEIYWKQALKLNDEIVYIKDSITKINKKDTTKKWYISEIFLNIDFVNFLNNINIVELNGKEIDKIPIQNEFGSLQEWANHYQLFEKHRIELDDILHLLQEKGCVKIFNKNNYIKHNVQNILDLQNEISERIKDS